MEEETLYLLGGKVSKEKLAEIKKLASRYENWYADFEDVGGISEIMVCKEMYVCSLRRMQELARACLDLSTELELAHKRLGHCQCGANTLPM
jgi:hypothetical protein